MIKTLFDIDVILDILEPRIEFYLDSFSVLSLCDLDEIEGWISADSHSTIHYFLRKKLDEFTSRNKIVNNLKSLSVIPVRNATLVSAFESQSPDFEDNLKMASAQIFNLDFIVTRNKRHFKHSPVEALTPQDFMNRYKSGDLLNEKISVPFLDLKAQHHQIYNEIDDRITNIIANTGFILGKHVDEFEEGFAEIQEAKYCIGVSSGTDALHVALMALGIGPGDEVILPVNTFIATAEAVSLCGAEPVFVDNDEYYNLDVMKLEELINHKAQGEGHKVKAVIPVHLYGQPANMDQIVALADEYELNVVEDCCQAHLAELNGKKVGNFGEFGAFSFYPGKNLGAYGESGALITNSEELYRKAKMIRQHGEIERYHHVVAGHNYRMEAIQGAVLAVKLRYLVEWTKKRQINASLYSELLKEIDGIEPPEELVGTESVYHLYVIQAADRDGLQGYLQKNGIASGLHYPVPLHFQEAYGHLGHKEGDFPMAERAAKRILSFPMYPELSEGHIRYVCDKAREFLLE